MPKTVTGADDEDVQGLKKGALDLNLISLFPPTYKGRKNGLRVDLAEAIAGLKPVSSSRLGVLPPSTFSGAQADSDIDIPPISRR